LVSLLKHQAMTGGQNGIDLLFCSITKGGFGVFWLFSFARIVVFSFIPTLLLLYEACNFTTDYCFCFMGVIFSGRIIALAVLSSCFEFKPSKRPR
jgi:hypothetical protein